MESETHLYSMVMRTSSTEISAEYLESRKLQEDSRGYAVNVRTIACTIPVPAHLLCSCG